MNTVGDHIGASRNDYAIHGNVTAIPRTMAARKRYFEMQEARLSLLTFINQNRSFHRVNKYLIFKTIP